MIYQKERMSYPTYSDLELEIQNLEQENKKLNEKYDGLWKIYTEDVNERVEENKKLKEDLEWYKKQYEHMMGED